MAYAVNYNNSVGQNEISSHSLMFSGDVELSPKWSLVYHQDMTLKIKV